MRISDWSSDVCSSDLDYVFSRTDHLEAAPDQAEIITIDFEKGDAVAINGEAMSPATLLVALNGYGKRHAIGRLELVENSFVGIKSRDIYEKPGGTILLRSEERCVGKECFGPSSSRCAR